MFRKTYYIIATIVIGLLVVSLISYYFWEEDRSANHIPPINAVPINSPLIIESQNFTKLLSSLVQENKLFKEIINNQSFSDLQKQTNFLYSLLKNNSDAADIVDDHSVIISTHLTGKDRIEYLFVVNVFNLKNEHKAQSILEDLLKNNATVTNRTYEKSTIYNVAFKGEEFKNLSYSFTDGFLVLSFSPMLVEQAIRQLESKTSLLNDKSFRQVSQAAGKNVNANIYLNYKTLPKLISVFLNPNVRNIVKTYNSFAEWSEFDVTVKEDAILLNGFTSAGDSSRNFLSTFANQRPQKIEIPSILPSNISGFISINLENFDLFHANFLKYLAATSKIDNYRIDINEVNDEYKIDIEKLFYSFLENEMTVVFSDVSRMDFSTGNYVIFKTKSQSLAKQQLTIILNKYAASQQQHISKFISTYNCEDGTIYPIYKMPIKNLPKRLFGNLFGKAYCDYFTFIDNYLIFGSSEKMLSSMINNYSLQKTLANDKNYREFAKSLSNESNLYVYLNMQRSTNSIGSHLTDELSVAWEKNIQTIGKFQAFGLQMSNSKEMIYSNLYVKYNPSFKASSATTWESRLDTTISMKPFFFVNHNTLEKEIFVQDQRNKIYLINHAGRILWEKQLDEKIIGNVYQADYYRNNKFQLLFGTAKKIHLIDRLGNYLPRYPILLPSPATNAIAAIDFDNNKDYKIAVACENQHIEMYSLDGNVVKNWQFGKTENKVITDIQYFRYANKDYLIFADKLKTYILNRFGFSVFDLKRTIPIAQNSNFWLDTKHQGKKNLPRFVTSATNGEIFYIYLDGSVDSKKIIECSESHFFEYEDVDNDGYKDYVFADGTKFQVISQSGKTIINHLFKEKISFEPSFFNFEGGAKKIGIVTKTDNQIFLLNANGTFYTGFPVEGQTPFRVGSFSKDKTKKYNLIVGSQEGFLFNYELK